MSLPLSRDFTLADGDEVPSVLLNNLQDQIINLQEGKFVETRKTFFPASTASIETGGSWVFNLGRYETYDGVTDGKYMEIPLTLPAGAMIVTTTVKAALASGAGTYGIACRLQARDLTAISSGAANKSGIEDGNTAGNCDVPVTPTTPEVIDEDHAWHMLINPHSAPASLRQVFGVLVEWYVP